MPLNTQRPALDIFEDKRQSYKEAANQIKKAVEWLKGLGINVNPSRAKTYEQNLEKISSHFEKGEADKLWNQISFHEFCYSIHEATDLIDIFEAFKNSSECDLIDRLKLAVGGTILSLNENTANNSNLSRNICFELVLAANFKIHGHSINFTQPKDFAVSMPNVIYYFECKRPFKIKTIPKSLKEGKKQLVERYKRHNSQIESRGIVAVDLSKVENIGNSYLNPTNASELNKKNRQIIEKYIRAYKSLLDTPTKPNTKGILFYIKVPAITKDHILYSGRHITFYAFKNIDDCDRSFIDSIK